MQEYVKCIYKSTVLSIFLVPEHNNLKQNYQITYKYILYYIIIIYYILYLYIILKYIIHMSAYLGKKKEFSFFVRSDHKEILNCLLGILQKDICVCLRRSPNLLFYWNFQLVGAGEHGFIPPPEVFVWKLKQLTRTGTNMAYRFLFPRF